MIPIANWVCVNCILMTDKSTHHNSRSKGNDYERH